MSYQIPNADGLVTYIKSFTGSSNDAEIKQCIFLAEMMMRNLELPALRSDPYDSQYIVAADSEGRIPIPADMLKPILFFNQGGSTASSTGPWVVYERVGDRDIITDGFIESYFQKPLNTPNTYKGKFSEVGSYYQFLPQLSQGTEINLYYYKSWPFLFALDSEGAEVQNNAVLNSFPEGYVYGTLHNYYIKRKSAEDANYYKAKFEESVKIVEDQNSKGKWSGGNTTMTSIFQPRRPQRYQVR